MKKLFILLIKYIPLIQLLAFLISNTLVYFNITFDNASYIDFIFGNSICNIITLYVASYVLKFCKWHRIIITTNFINLIILFIDCKIGIPISNFMLLFTYYIAAIITLLVIIKINLNNKYNDNL